MKEINGKTRLCGLIGNPVVHTLSPMIHNYIAGQMGHNMVYVPFHVEEDLEKAVRGGYALNVLGMNVTVPYKKEVMDFLVEVDDAAGRIGAVNTLVRTEHGFKGYNSDYLGLMKAMEEEHVVVKGRDVVILGAGGAANAVVYLCGQLGAKRVFILNRTIERAQKLAWKNAAFFPNTQFDAMEMQDYGKLPEQKFIVIQTTSVGLHPNCDKAVIEDVSFYKKVEKAVDIIYNPEETRFMKLVSEQGGEVCNGLTMLLYQGVKAYELWNDVVVDEQICQRLKQLLKEKVGS